MKNKITRLLQNLDYAIQPVLMITLLLVALIQVLYRFVPWLKTPWSLEVITFLFSSSVWIGISIAIKEDAHVGIKAVYDLFPMKVRKVLKVISLLLFGLMMILFGYLGSIVLLGYYKSNSLTPAAHLPYWFVRSPIVLGCLLSLYRIIEKIVKVLKNEDPEFYLNPSNEPVHIILTNEKSDESEVTV